MIALEYQLVTMGMHPTDVEKRATRRDAAVLPFVPRPVPSTPLPGCVSTTVAA